ncbi:hypothetical protein FRC11_006041 [Ceratobasidium sp. 423]|nr:hypothetical protein FRC11_006041 [Ceratobasidium sp. 423]
MPIPCEVVGSIPRPIKLQRAFAAYEARQMTFEQLEPEIDAACEDTVRRMEDAGQLVVTDGEQRISSFATYPIFDTLHGTGLAENLMDDGHGQFFAIERLLDFFLELNNRVLDRFTAVERVHIGVHTCPGGGWDSTHTLDAPYELLLKEMFKLNAGYFLIQCASEKDRNKVFKLIGKNIRRDANGVKQMAYIGVTSTIDPRVETPEEIAQMLVAATKYIPADQLGATDDCGFSPFCDDKKPKHGGSPDFARDIAFQKIAARVKGARIASERLGV